MPAECFGHAERKVRLAFERGGPVATKRRHAEDLAAAGQRDGLQRSEHDVAAVVQQDAVEVAAVPAGLPLRREARAEPNEPYGEVTASGTKVRLTLFPNPWAHVAGKDETGCLTFVQCAMRRPGATNDEGWSFGQCRYGNAAPAWGEVYELLGDDHQRLPPTHWHELVPSTAKKQHFLFYLKDSTFECFAASWRFERGVPSE